MNRIFRAILLFLSCFILCVLSFGCSHAPEVRDVPAEDEAVILSQEIEQEDIKARETEIQAPSAPKEPEIKKEVQAPPAKPEETAPAPEPVKPAEEEKVDAVVENLCTLTVRCDTILKNISGLNPDKVGLIPADGVIFSGTNITFNPGESVFNVLLRELKRNKIHLEFTNTPLYSSAYIEGINNIYEFDCGELSGWMYKVNGEFPGYGCSRCILKPGDVIEWVYTCDLGRDVGGGGAAIGGAGTKNEEG